MNYAEIYKIDKAIHKYKRLKMPATQNTKVVYIDTYRDGYTIMLIAENDRQISPMHNDCVGRQSFKFGGCFHRNYLAARRVQLVTNRSAPAA